MAFTIESKYASEIGDNGAKIFFVIRSDTAPSDVDETPDARAFLIANAPATYNSLDFNSHSITEEGGGRLWMGWAGYGRLKPPSFGELNPQAKPEGDDYAFRFTTSGRTEKITHATVVNSYAVDASGTSTTPPDYGGGINVTPEGVEGVDVVVPQFDWTEEHAFDTLPGTTIDAIATATGRVNGSTFRGFDAGTVLFTGADGGWSTSAEEWRVTYSFSFRPNETGITIGDLTGIEKDGHDYVWVETRPTVDANGNSAQTPKAAFVHKVYPDGDFSGIGV